MSERQCSFCHSIDLCYLGALGNLAWFRCRDCGQDQTGPAPEEDPAGCDDCLRLNSLCAAHAGEVR